jgi:hypothetical protein
MINGIRRSRKREMPEKRNNLSLRFLEMSSIRMILSPLSKLTIYPLGMKMMEISGRKARRVMKKRR